MKHLQTDNAPAPLGPYSQATIEGNTLYVAMQVPATKDGELNTDISLEDQTKQVLENIKAIAEAANTTMDKTLRMMLYTTDISQGKTVNAIYETYFNDPKPARGVIEVSALPLGFKIAMDAIISLD